tara:strand:+ start:460 stop:1248 length:789 start_codon:yes stop_codon:yes gene_type:complete
MLKLSTILPSLRKISSSIVNLREESRKNTIIPRISSMKNIEITSQTNKLKSIISNIKIPNTKVLLEKNKQISNDIVSFNVDIIKDYVNDIEKSYDDYFDKINNFLDNMPTDEKVEKEEIIEIKIKRKDSNRFDINKILNRSSSLLPLLTLGGSSLLSSAEKDKSGDDTDVKKEEKIKPETPKTEEIPPEESETEESETEESETEESDPDPKRPPLGSPGNPITVYPGQPYYRDPTKNPLYRFNYTGSNPLSPKSSEPKNPLQ